MDRLQDACMTEDGFPPPLTPERAERALERVAAIRERIRLRGVDPSQLPDPVEELSKARPAGGWEWRDSVASAGGAVFASIVVRWLAGGPFGEECREAWSRCAVACARGGLPAIV